jgi:hypothetical protein
VRRGVSVAGHLPSTGYVLTGKNFPFSKRLVNVPSRQLERHALNLPHIVVRNRTCLSVIPINRNFTPNRSDNRTEIGCRASLTDPITGLEGSGLVAGHALNLLPTAAAS